MMNDIEGWGAPERLGLRRELGGRAILARCCIAAALFGAVVLGLGAYSGSF